MKPTKRDVAPKVLKSIRTTVDINFETYKRVQQFMVDECKNTGKRVFLKDLVSPALDLYIATLGGK